MSYFFSPVLINVFFLIHILWCYFMLIRFSQSIYLLLYFFFGDFKVHQKDFSIRTTLLINFLTKIPDSVSISCALLDLIISSNTIIWSMVDFCPFGNSDNVIVSVSIDFPSKSKEDAPFHFTFFDYSLADLDSLFDHLGDVSWISEMFHSRDVNIMSSLIHLHGFQLLVLLR